MTTPQKPVEWEQEFDERFVGAEKIYNTDDVKDFIHYTLAVREEELENNLEESAWAKAFAAMKVDEYREELRREVEALKKECTENPAICMDNGCLVGEHNDALDAVLALLGTDKD